MEKYILIWNIDDYPDMGGGIEWGTTDSHGALEKLVNSVMKDSRAKILYCSKLGERMEIKEVERVTEWKVVDRL